MTEVAATPGLRAVRASMSPATLIAAGPGHLVLQTAWRQDFREGNAIHVDGVVDPGNLDRWLQAFEERLGHLAGVDHVLVRWETGDELTEAGRYADDLGAAVTRRGVALDRLTVMELTDRARPMVPLTDDVQVVRAGRDEHWWGVRALQISAFGEVDFHTWSTDRAREAADGGRGAAWLAYRFGIPVASAGVWRDGAGVAVVDDVVTHAVHRRLGIASHLVAVAVEAHRELAPDDRILLLTEHGSDAERLYARLGFGAIGTVWGVVGAGRGAPDRR